MISLVTKGVLQQIAKNIFPAKEEIDIVINDKVDIVIEDKIQINAYISSVPVED